MTLSKATLAIRAQEPIFHCPEHGTHREDFDRMMAEDFSEVGASGRLYSRSFVLDTLTQRHSTPQVEDFIVTDFSCRELAPNLYLATYTLLQPPTRLTRRSTIWQHQHGAWKIAFHQGTIIQP